MKNVYYVIIPTIAFFLILINALYGHALFASNTEQVFNKYSIYIRFLPEWHSHQKSLIFDVTNSWYKMSTSNDDSKKIHEKHNANELQHVNGKSYVELKHDFSECVDEWQPILYRKAIDTIRHEIEYIQGLQLNPDPDISVYPNVENASYDNLEQKKKLDTAYSQFIPICTSKEITSYDYSIKIDGDELGFDAYFVPSKAERDGFYNSDFEYYDQLGCFTQNQKSFSGTCKNIGQYSGLLIVIPDELKHPITKVAVNIYEKKL